MTVDISKMTATEIAALLSQVRKAEKEQKDAIKALPQWAFLMVMEDSKLVFWSGKADTHDSAVAAAIVYAEKEGAKVFVDTAGNIAIAPRPLPSPRGRQAKATPQDVVS